MRGKKLIIYLIGILSFFSCNKEDEKGVDALLKLEYAIPTAMTSDYFGNIWMADGEMIGKCTPISVSNSEFLSIGEISSISVYDTSRITVGGESGYALYINGEWDIIPNDNNSGYGVPCVYCNKDIIYVDRTKDFIIIENNETTYLTKDGIQFPDCEVNKIQVNSQNEIVLATNEQGIIVFKDGNWTVYDTVKKVDDLVIDDKDLIYYVFPGKQGIHKLDNGIYSNLVPPETVLGSTHMWSISLDSDGNIWCGSTSSIYDGALFKYKTSENTWSSIQADNDYAHDSFQIGKLAIDKFNNVWFSSGYSSLCIYNPEGVKY